MDYQSSSSPDPWPDYDQVPLDPSPYTVDKEPTPYPPPPPSYILRGWAQRPGWRQLVLIGSAGLFVVILAGIIGLILFNQPSRAPTPTVAELTATAAAVQLGQATPTGSPTATATARSTTATAKPTAASTRQPTSVPCLTCGAPTATATPQPTATPMPFITRVDDAIQGNQQDQFNYIGTGWAHNTGAANYYDDTYSISAETGDYVTFVFIGDDIQLVSDPNNNLGYVGITIDGGAVDLVDLYSATPAYQRVVFDSGQLSEGIHTLKVVVTGVSDPASSGDAGLIDEVIFYTIPPS